MESFSTEAIVLKRRDFGEADRLVTFFTKHKGKITAVAKGVRKTTSRRAPNIELLNHTKIFLHGTRGLPILTEAEAVESFPRLKEDLEKLSLCYLLLELVDRFLEDGEENQDIFNLLSDTLNAMDGVDLEKGRLLQNSFQIKFLNHIGYLPQLYRCVNCRTEIIPENNFLSPHLGGLIDSSCSDGSLLSKRVTSSAIKTLRFLESRPVDMVGKLVLAKNTMSEVSSLLNFYTTFFLEKDLQSVNFASQVDRVLNV